MEIETLLMEPKEWEHIFLGHDESDIGATFAHFKHGGKAQHSFKIRLDLIHSFGPDYSLGTPSRRAAYMKKGDKLLRIGALTPAQEEKLQQAIDAFFERAGRLQPRAAKPGLAKSK